MAEHVPYKITSQEKTQKFEPNNTFQEVWRVTYEGPENYHSFVDVPATQYNAATVDQLIEQELESVMEVHNLGEQPHPENLATE